jgi:hypothetical protein
MTCIDCYFKSNYPSSYIKRIGYFYCKYKGIILKSPVECSFKVPQEITCAVCEKNKATWIATLDSGERDFICDECEKEVRYDFVKKAVLLSNAKLSTVENVWIERERRNNVLSKLSEKERETYFYIKRCGGKFLLRSLSKKEIGCLGKLIRENLGEIKNIKFKGKELKYFSLK